MNLFQWISKPGAPSKRAVAKGLSINESTLYKYINREREPRLVTAIKIVQMTGGQVSFLDLVIDANTAKVRPIPTIADSFFEQQREEEHEGYGRGPLDVVAEEFEDDLDDIL